MPAIRCLGLNGFLEVFTYFAHISPEWAQWVEPSGQEPETSPAAAEDDTRHRPDG